ncbi:hypothetical protein BLA24064_01371 [Burkholderia latens]|uniref:Uncharacterized protein n=1 Tax=Burkholderia latens TaxID=488446 RepID=A0A6P2IR63_9BURK|nr:hypothetical protein BLA24064_01371 [Burkholderia latens]
MQRLCQPQAHTYVQDRKRMHGGEADDGVRGARARWTISSSRMPVR